MYALTITQTPPPLTESHAYTHTHFYSTHVPNSTRENRQTVNWKNCVYVLSVVKVLYIYTSVLFCDVIAHAVIMLEI